jgi:hypothetical protein
MPQRSDGICLSLEVARLDAADKREVRPGTHCDRLPPSEFRKKDTYRSLALCGQQWGEGRLRRIARNGRQRHKHADGSSRLSYGTDLQGAVFAYTDRFVSNRKTSGGRDKRLRHPDDFTSRIESNAVNRIPLPAIADNGAEEEALAVVLAEMPPDAPRHPAALCFHSQP